MQRTNWRPRAALVQTLGLALLAPASAWAVGGPPPGSIEAGTLTLPSGPGSVRGLADDATVNVFTGQASYQIDFELPAGPGGFRPSLGLNYEGAFGNGPYGVGWGLTLPHVRRDTRLGVPDYASTDLVLEIVGIGGGGPLVAVGDGTYRIEGKGNSVRVEVFLSPTGVPTVLRATDSDGVIYFLGSTPAGRQRDGQRTYAWYAQFVQYPSGQSIALQYTHDRGQIYLDRMSWGPSSTLSADLAYEARPDPVASYRAGFRVETQQRLAGVEVGASGEVARSYELDYDESFPLSRLESITQRGRGGNLQLPATVLGYGPLETPAVVSVPGTGGWSLHDPNVTLIDIDGDGIADLVRFASAGHQFRRNLGSSFGPPQPLPTDLPGAQPQLSVVRLMDMRGTARPELVRVSGQSWQVMALEDRSWQTIGTWSGTSNLSLSSPTFAFTDLDGDQRTDLVIAAGSGLEVRFNGDGELGPGQSRGPVSSTALIAPGQPGVSFFDMNGDGLADAVHRGLTRVAVHPGRGDGTFDTEYSITYPSTITVSNPDEEVRLADLNRDGVTDLVYVASGEVMGFLARPDGSLLDGFTVPRPEVVGPGQPLLDVHIALVDANGNGSLDVVWSSPRGFWVLDLAGSTNAGMLTAIENGLGQVASFTYASSAQLALADELDPQEPDWTRRLPVSVPVPIRVERALASGEPDRVTRFRVRDGFWDAAEHRFGGFLIGTRIEEGDATTATLVERTHFHPGLGADRVLRGAPLVIERADESGAELSREEMDWVAHHVTSLPASEPRLRVATMVERRTIHSEGTSSPITVLDTFGYDGEGNRDLTYYWGRQDRTDPTLRIVRTFAHNATTWVRGRLVEETAEDDAGELMWRVRTLYDGAASPLPQGQLTAGWPRRIEAWHGDQGRWITQQAIDYDAAGNPIRRTSSGVTRDIEYDPNGLFPVGEEVSPTSGQTLSWSAEWDEVLGLPVEVTDPNGVTHEIGYDDLGRLETTGLRGQSPNVTYLYDWTAPRPRTTKLLNDGVAGDRMAITVHNSRGEALYEAQRMSPSSWIIGDFASRDARGQVAFTAVPFAWNSAALPTSIPPSTPGWTTVRDPLGRVVSEVLPDGSQRTLTYEPLATVETRTDLSPVMRESDGYGRIVYTERLVDGQLEWANTAYDATGRIVEFSLQGALARHEFDYDSLGRLVFASDPDAGDRSYTYTDGNQVSKQTNGEGQSIGYTYDGAGRLIRRRGSEGTTYEYHYDYPQSGTPAQGLTLGKVAWVREPAGDVNFEYDEFGRVRRVERTVMGITATVDRLFSANGLLLDEIYDDGFSVDYGHDPAGRVVEVGKHWRAIDVDAGGRVLREEYGSGVTQEYDVDSLGRTTGVRVDGSSRLLDLTIQRTSFGSPAIVTDQDGAGEDHSAVYGFDGGARLVSAQVGGAQVDYSYDGLQNLVSRTLSAGAAPILTGVYEYGIGAHGPRQLAAVDGKTLFEYDGAGRVTRHDKRMLTFDPFDRLVRVADGGDVIEYMYGHDGARVYTQSPGGQEERRFDARDVLMANGTRRHYLRVGDRQVGRIDVTGSAQEEVYFHVAAGAGPALVTDSRGNLLDERLYEPFGAPILADLSVDPVGDGNQPLDERTGWSDHGARWLAPDVARWQSPDPLVLQPQLHFAGDPWGLNPYQYVRNNPTTYWDPDGREEQPYLPGINAPIDYTLFDPLPPVPQRTPNIIERAINWISGRTKTKAQVSAKVENVKLKSNGKESGVDIGIGPVSVGGSRKENGNLAAKVELGAGKKWGHDGVDRVEVKAAVGAEAELDPDARDHSIGKVSVYAKVTAALKSFLNIEGEVKTTIAEERVKLRGASDGMTARDEQFERQLGERPEYPYADLQKEGREVQENAEH